MTSTLPTSWPHFKLLQRQDDNPGIVAITWQITSRMFVRESDRVELPGRRNAVFGHLIRPSGGPDQLVVFRARPG